MAKCEHKTACAVWSDDQESVIAYACVDCGARGIRPLLVPTANLAKDNANCHSHPGANRNADGDCIECARERTAEATAQEGGIRRSVTAPKTDDDPVDPATKFGEMARQVTVPVIAPDAFDDEHFDVDVDARFDITDEILPDESAK